MLNQRGGSLSKKKYPIFDNKKRKRAFGQEKKRLSHLDQEKEEN